MTAQPRFAVLGVTLALGVSVQGLGAQAMQSVPVAQEFESLHFRSIGPATMSGRISDLAVYEANPAIYYVGTAHGGVWKTTSNGATYEALFQDQGLISIGDVTISQTNPDLLWVGTGEANNRQSTSFGGGVWKSTDGGETFQFMGLPDSRHINRILIHPDNNDVVLVAATGPLSGPGGDRGVYKTTNGGQSWTQVLEVDEWTGANDLVMAETDPNIIYASTYQRQRTNCCMNGGGPGSGVWKSTNAGDTWTRITGNGFADGPLGRIALDVFRQSANVVYALVQGTGGGRGGGGESTNGVYRSNDGGQNWEHVSTTNPRPMYFSQIRIDPNDVERLYLGGVGLHLSIDGGASFETDAAQATHDDVHAIWIDPNNPEHVLIGNDGGLAVTYDRSHTWVFLPNLPVGLFYHASYDMAYPFNVCGGMQDNYNWCGPSESRLSRGIMNYDWAHVQGGDGFHAIPDLRDWRIVYTESQNGNMVRRNRVTGESKNIRPNTGNVVNADPDDSYRFHWDAPLMISPNDPGVLLAAANHLFRSTNRGDTWERISADLTKNAERDTIVLMGVPNSEVSISRNDGISNWSTLVSIAESPAQPELYYTGSDDGVLSVSRDGGGTWTDITANLPGMPNNAWISEVVPSRFDAATVYVTVDNHLQNDFDTYIWASSDYGQTFRSISNNLSGENARTLTEDTRNPDVLYVGTETGIFLSLDRGQSWRRLKANLPTVRIDEITLHPRDNAMIVATHGRALWILDHLEPIQEYTAAQAANAMLFSVPDALQWKTKNDRNSNFWGHMFFTGENPPDDAVISYHLRSQANSVNVRITNSMGQTVREIEAPAERRAAGIQSVCWDMRWAPIEAPDFGGAAEPAGGGGGRGGGGGGGRGGGGADIPGIPQSQPDPGYMPSNPCGGGGGGGRGGGGGGGSPHVAPGQYSVSLMVNGSAAGTKSINLIQDPDIQMTVAERQRYNQVVDELHVLEQRGAIMEAALEALMPQMQDLAGRVPNAGNVPNNAKQQFQQLNQAFEAVRAKFGVEPQPEEEAGGGGGRGGRGGGRGGGAPDPDNVYGRAGDLKGEILSFWEVPSGALMAESNAVRAGLSQAIREAGALLDQARTVGQSLSQYGMNLNVPNTSSM